MTYHMKCEVSKVTKLASDVYDMWITSPSIAEAAVPGQFVNIHLNSGGHILPRPISICEIEKDKFRIAYRVVGAGTEEMSLAKPGDTFFVTGPVGNGYDVDYINATFKEIVLFGGGIGIPPMIELAKRLTIKKTTIAGYRDELFLKDDIEKFSDLLISTDLGTYGRKGNVLDVFENEYKGSPDAFAACGPLPMLRGVKKKAEDLGIPCFISLEERMACGVGACLGCVCSTEKENEYSKVKNARVCVDGPVFLASEVTL